MESNSLRNSSSNLVSSSSSTLNLSNTIMNNIGTSSNTTPTTLSNSGGVMNSLLFTSSGISSTSSTSIVSSVNNGLNLGGSSNTTSLTSSNNSNTTSSANAEDITITIYPIGIKTYGCLPPFLMRKHTLFKRLFVHVSNRFCIDENELLFFFQDKLLPEQCPSDIGLGNGDIIVVRRVPPKPKQEPSKQIASFVLDIGSLYDNSSFSDITFVLQDESTLPAHKNVLSARCEKFKAMFQGQMKESLENEIKVTEYTPPVFRKMIEYLYTDSLNEDNIEMILKLIIIADEYLLHSLKTLCEHKLISEISSSNAPLLFSHSDTYNCQQLKKHCQNYILTNIKKLAGTEEFEKVLSGSPNLLLELIKEMAPQYDNNPNTPSKARRKDYTEV